MERLMVRPLALVFPFLHHHESNHAQRIMFKIQEQDQERGASVRTAIIRSGMKMTRVAKLLKISRPTLNRRLHDPFLDFEFIREVGKIISYDFGQLFPEMNVQQGLVEEPLAAHQINTLEGCKDKLLHLYGLYTDVLQKYNALLITTFQK